MRIAPGLVPAWLRGPWAATLAATAVSTYALDATATVAGTALVASGALDDAGRQLLLAVLVLSYVAWGASLRVNLAANAELLARTGGSTNALSKAAHDLARRRGWDARARRRAASAGYVVAELAKEAPYYLGASGAALLSAELTVDDVLVFLLGANLGAAVYEYVLARGTRFWLRRDGRAATTASFDDDWVPAAYLADYYATVEADERHTIAYFVERLRGAQRGAPVLVYGVGPTLHHVFPAAAVASELHLTDYLDCNLDEIRRWVAREPGAHDWRPFVAYALECEGVREPTEAQIEEREALTRRLITRVVRADAGARRPVGAYATVISAYCADSATADQEVWRRYLRHIAGSVRPGGLFLTAALRRCSSYAVGGSRFPCADVDEDDVREVLAAAFSPAAGSVEVRALPEQAGHGYDGIVLAAARAPG